jgi:hypothetical protein
MEMDTRSQVGIPTFKMVLHWDTRPAADCICPANNSPNGCQWMCNHRYYQLVRWPQGSETRRFLLLEVLSSRTELLHWWLGAIGHRGINEIVASLPPGHQLQGWNLVRQQWSQILPDIESHFQKTSQVVTNCFGLRLCHPEPGSHQDFCRRHIQTAQLLDLLWMA